MNVQVNPTRSVSGKVRAPPSKAQTHRAIFAGLLSRGTTTIHNPLSCKDTEASANAATSLGAQVQFENETWKVKSDGTPRPPLGRVECGESGVTLRFTIPIASLTGTDVHLTGSPTLLRRPLQPLIDAMSQIGVGISSEERVVNVNGTSINGGAVRIPGDVSSQFISGLLFAAPLMRDGLEITVTSPLESRGYIGLTIQTLKQHGIKVENNNEFSLFHITGHQSYTPVDHWIPGDYSSAAFLMAAAAVTGSSLDVVGLGETEEEPDSVFLKILTQMGARATLSSGELHVEGGSLNPIRVNISDCPDLGPIVAVLGVCADGKTEITGAERLRYKESDRLSAMAIELRKLGAAVEETSGGLVTLGPSILRGGTVDSHGDHRIAMALAVAALTSTEPVTIRSAEAVSKSYPRFFEDFRSIGVDAIER